MKKLRIGLQSIDIYEYYVTNACVFKFVDKNFEDVKSFFGNMIIKEFDILDENNMVIDSKSALNVKLSTLQAADETIKYIDKILISEEYTEDIVNDNGINETVTHQPQYKEIERVEVKTIYIAILEKISLEDEIEKLKEYIKISDPSNYDLFEYKEYWINNGKEQLKKYIEDKPLISDCHGNKTATYTITEEKRNIFLGKWTYHQLLVSGGIEDVMTWNASGEICEPWTDSECLELIREWNDIINSLVIYQQSVEKQIQEAISIDAIKDIAFDYDRADIRNIS